MIRPIVRDEFFLAQKSVPATKEDAKIITDLVDTLEANKEHCVGMAANMIGIKKRIIVFYAGPFIISMVNPVIRKRSNSYETQEGCLSLDGVRNTTRYEKIQVGYLDEKFKEQTQEFTGFTAQIIQHEIDHLEGKVI